jgi:hypothetical protein
MIPARVAEKPRKSGTNPVRCEVLASVSCSAHGTDSHAQRALPRFRVSTERGRMNRGRLRMNQWDWADWLAKVGPFLGGLGLLLAGAAALINAISPLLH